MYILQNYCTGVSVTFDEVLLKGNCNSICIDPLCVAHDWNLLSINFCNVCNDLSHK